MWKRGSVKVGQKISYWNLGCLLQWQEPTWLFVHWNPWFVVTTRHNHRTKYKLIIRNILWFFHTNSLVSITLKDVPLRQDIISNS